ncbi:unnamed protein product [Didymodactylos carnosus]|uniref:F-box domain-containing protein n=1 Tax=Didymodactylos carnosus TaxID=1234261 RepID=A0A816B5T2_9BILA|nr:unnamed protein product [Didymodactylos carnosus]CAF1605947.1 unnamed protein product [Didymodactylos carnosus]CAF4226209.1 unnamed protein product [Didymodactylos carnosus]CAF4485804.1 unnamed protein product [Didymodactylos carnosus]
MATTSTQNYFSILPDEILFQIFYQIRPFDHLLKAVSRVCRHWHQLIFNELFINNYYRKKKYRQPNLIGWWRFQNSDAIGYDSSGLIGRCFTVTGQPKVDECFLGHCAVFDQYSSIQVPIGSYNEYQTDLFTIAVWVYFNETDKGLWSWSTFLAAWQDDIKKNWIHLG